MDLGANTILITGGATGIGLALAERFLQAGSQVVVCGRREDKLRAAQASRASREELEALFARMNPKNAA